MPWNLLLLPFLGGFFFCRWCHYFRYAFQRLDGYRLLIYSSIAGFLLLGAGRALDYCIVTSVPGGVTLEAFWQQLVPFPFAGTAVAAFALGWVLPLPVNAAFGRRAALEEAMKRSQDDLVVMLHEAAENNRPLYVSLDNRKVYVGFVLNSPNLEQAKSSVSLLPLRSGYRDAGSLTTTFTVFHEDLYLSEQASAEAFRIGIPIARIASVQFYDPEIYDRFFGTTIVRP